MYWCSSSSTSVNYFHPVNIYIFPILSLSNHIYIILIVHLGPNATTFIVPGECFPTRYRSTSTGISAASGKIGSIIAQAGIAPLRTRGATKTNANPWQNHVMQIYSLFMFLGIFTTLLIPETKRLTLEKLSGEYDSSDESVTGVDVEVLKPGSKVSQEGMAGGVVKAGLSEK
jgi:Sugar (and other) transporter